MLDSTSVTRPESELLDGTRSTLKVLTDAVFVYAVGYGGEAGRRMSASTVIVRACPTPDGTSPRLHENCVRLASVQEPAGLTIAVNGCASSMFAGSVSVRTD
jgi:hypothetical protein